MLLFSDTFVLPFVYFSTKIYCNLQHNYFIIPEIQWCLWWKDTKTRGENGIYGPFLGTVLSFNIEMSLRWKDTSNVRTPLWVLVRGTTAYCFFTYCLVWHVSQWIYQIMFLLQETFALFLDLQWIVQIKIK